MDIEILREFSTLAIVRNYSEAARQANVSQPTLSRHIASLEAELHCDLVNRTVPVTLTPAGEQILEQVNDILSSYDAIVATAKLARRSPRRVIVVQDYSFSLQAFDFISRCERAFEDDRPDVAFRNIECPSGKEHCQLLESRVLDIGFVHTFDDGTNLQQPVLPEGIGAAFVPRLRGQLALSYRADNPLLRENPKALSDFEHIGFLSPAERYLDAFRDSFTSFCQHHAGFRPKFDYRAMYSHRYFYTNDPETSAYIGWSFEDQEQSLVPWIATDLRTTVFEDYYFNTYALYSKENADQHVLDFIELISSPADPKQTRREPNR